MSNIHVNKAIKSLKWSFLSELFIKISSPLLTLVLTKILLPEDFGIFGSCMAVIMIVISFQDLGFHQALIQKQNRIKLSLDSSFWVLWLFSFFLFVLIFFTAPATANFLHSQKSVLIIRLLSIEIILPTLIPTIILIKKFCFKTLLIINLLSTIISGFLTIFLAVFHFGYYALLIGSLTGNLINCIFLWAVTKWRPKIRVNFGILKELFSFGKWILIENFLLAFYSYGASIIIAHQLGFYDSGIYQIGLATATFAFSLTIYPIVQVIYPLLSKLQKNKKAFIKILTQTTETFAIIALPIGLGLLFFGNAFASLFWKNKWHDIGFVIGVLGIKNVVASIFLAFPEGMKAIKKPEVNIKSAMFDLIFFLLVFFFLPAFGLKIFVVGLMAATTLGTFVFTYFIKKYLAINLYDLGKLFYPAFLNSVLILPLFYIFSHLSDSFTGVMGWAKLLVEFIIIISIYTLIFSRIFPKKFEEIKLSTFKILPLNINQFIKT